MQRAFVQTYGCQMNEHDSFRMMEILSSLGYEMTEDIREAGLILVNTCSVRRNPENKVYSFLGQLVPLKQAHPELIIGVAGCVAQQEGENILKRSAVVDMVFGPDNYFRLPEMIDAVRAGRRTAMTEWLPGKGRVQNFIPEEWIERGHVDGCRAYIAISKGCSNLCSFCIVPSVRGREVSREPENILREAKALIEKGAREIWLLGQNVNSYKAGDWGFRELLDAVSQLDLRRLRFTSPHPKNWSNALSDLMAARPAICNQLHLPLQAGADRVLALMNRRHTIREYLDKIAYVKSVNPGIEISTDIIVGFPTETKAEFEETLRVLEEVRFSQVYSFKYSPRPGTRASGMPDDVPRAVKEERLARLIEVQDRINAEQLARYVGTVQEVMIDGAHPKQEQVWSGRTDGYRPVSIRRPHLEIGDVVDVRITGHQGHWLQGEVIAPPNVTK
jgi:tRNA-2-methylthio-N6-dimethylallyladenosine synthase